MERKANRIYRAWERFIGQQELEPYVVSKTVANSWQRCARWGLDAYSSLEHLKALKDRVLEKRIARRRNLMEVAGPFMDQLFNFVKGSDFLVLLSDDHGYILEERSDPVIKHRTKHFSLGKGAILSEQAAGTNAVGTALFERKPVQIFSSEHYCKIFHPLTGSAAPIFDPKGELLGVLDLVGFYEQAHPHTLGMVVAAVKAIENQLHYQRSSEEAYRAYTHISTLMETMSEGIVSIDRLKRITHINSLGAKILGLNPRECLHQPIDEVLGEPKEILKVLETGRGFAEQEIAIDRDKGPLLLSCTAKPIFGQHNQVREVIATLREIKTVHRLVNQVVGAEATFRFGDIISGNNYEMAQTIQKAKKVAKSNCTVLLQAESGTGKELFAQAIHNYSSRSRGPFIVLNCGAIPRELVESELFGYEEGAFTGARRGGRPGKFELANGGTIFLDEIGDMPLEAQVSILRVLQDKCVTRIGGQITIPVNIRIIAATHRDLSEAVEKGNFRLDLFYRLNVVTLNIPSLRDRKEDIPALTRFFVEKTSRKLGIETPNISREVLEKLAQYHWPGNVRELENVVEQALHILEGSTLLLEHLPGRVTGLPYPGTNNSQANELLRNSESELIQGTLARCDWNVSQAAKILGIGRATLYRKMRTYNCMPNRG